MSNKELGGKVAELVDTLPPMPATIMELREAAADPDCNYKRIIPHLKKDPGLCADVLRIANSALFGVSHKVETVEESVRYFGMNRLIDYVATSFSEKVVRDSFRSLRNLSDYFDHSAQISAAAHIIAKHANMNSHDQDMFTVAGLLHDIGRLVLALAGSKQGSPLMGRAYSEMEEVIADEKETMGVNHCEVGAIICEKWQFPDRLVEGVFRHHTPMKKNDLSKPGAVIFLGHIVTFDDIPETMLRNAIPEETLEKLGITADLLVECRDDYFHLVKEGVLT